GVHPVPGRPPVTEGGTPMADAPTPAPKTVKGPKDQTLTWRRKVDFVRSTPYPRVEPPSAEEMRPVLDLTDEALAAALRPTGNRGGHEYVGECPPEFARRLRSPEHRPQAKAASPLSRSPTERHEARGMRPMSGIIGPDDRVVRRDNTEYPWSTVTYLPRDSGG